MTLIDLLAMAPTPTDAGADAPPMWTQMLPFGLMLVLFYFLLIRPQMNRQKELDNLVKSIKTGDKVVAAGGIIGTVTNVKDQVIVLKVADGVKIEVQRSSVSSVINNGEAIAPTSVS